MRILAINPGVGIRKCLPIFMFDLIKTKQALAQACDVLTKASKEGKTILLLGTKKQAKEKTKEVAQKAGCFYVTERWLGGTLTNIEMIKKSIKKLIEMKNKREKGEYNQYTKKERLLIEREIERLERFFSGLVGLEKIPDLIVIIDIKRESSAVNETQQKQVETIAIVDSNSDPTLVTYPIPMNDDATKAVEYVLELFGEAIQEGKNPVAKVQRRKQGNRSRTSSASKAGRIRRKNK